MGVKWGKGLLMWCFSASGSTVFDPALGNELPSVLAMDGGLRRMDWSVAGTPKHIEATKSVDGGELSLSDRI